MRYAVDGARSYMEEDASDSDDDSDAKSDDDSDAKSDETGEESEDGDDAGNPAASAACQSVRRGDDAEGTPEMSPLPLSPVHSPG